MAKVIELYVCSICGVTNETRKHWGPICKKTGGRVCAECCYRCDHRVSWSGIWRCGYKTEEMRKQESLERARNRFDAEAARISEVYNSRKREQARQRAIKAARARQRNK